MPVTSSIGQKIKQLLGLLGTSDITEWESRFIASIWEQSRGGTYTTGLSGNQVERIDEIYAKHFS